MRQKDHAKPLGHTVQSFGAAAGNDAGALEALAGADEAIAGSGLSV